MNLSDYARVARLKSLRRHALKKGKKARAKRLKREIKQLEYPE